MDVTGKVHSIQRDFKTGKVLLTFEINEEPAEELNAIAGVDKLTITAKKYRKKRSLDANALLWLCLGRIAEALNSDKWSIYLQMLKRYGQYTYICVKPNVVESVKLQWRECEEIGEIDINGQKAIQMLCYFGSSTYNTKEFSVLLDGVIQEMKGIGIEAPTTEEMRRALELWEQLNSGKK